MRNHTDLLNYLIQTFDLKSYLEIGVQNPKNNFDKIKCDDKTGVEPNLQVPNKSGYVSQHTSDEFFSNASNHNVKYEFDLIFIDGLHHADQVKRDFENSLKCLSYNGFIVIHDTLPTDEKYTHVPRSSKIWFGDVYKFAMTLESYSGINYVTVDFDCGCTVVYRDRSKKTTKKITDYNWQDYVSLKDHKLRIISVETFIQTFYTTNRQMV